MGVLGGAVAGFFAESTVSDLIGNTWSYCVNEAWVPTIEEADSPRFGLLFGDELLWLAAYVVAFPLAFSVVWLVLRPHVRSGLRSAAVSCLAGLCLLAVPAAADIELNLAPKGGHYLPERCPDGRPPWWPSGLPLDTW